VPHTLRFLARASRPIPLPKLVQLDNPGGGTLHLAQRPRVEYLTGAGWLTVEPRGPGNRQSLLVSVNAGDHRPGSYVALVTVACPGAVNSPQSFRVVLQVSDTPPTEHAVVDDRDGGCYATPGFWVGHQFCRCPCEKRGYKGFYLTNGNRAAADEFVRFVPDLAGGRYLVSLHDKTPFHSDTAFSARVRDITRDHQLRVRPDRSLELGEFVFAEGTDGFVEIQAAGAEGLVIADAVVFRRLGDR
jgi:hypothetical protein